MERKYEVLVLLQPNLEKIELEDLVKQIESKLAGKIIAKEDWGVKGLAYKIQHKTEAHYIHYYLETTTEAVADFKSFVAIEKNIMRQMTLRHEGKWPFERKTSKNLKFPERKPRGERPMGKQLPKDHIKTVEKVETKIESKGESND